MSPLTVTWPQFYTLHMEKKILQLAKRTILTIFLQRNKELMKYLTKQSILNLLHPFQTFILGQKTLHLKLQQSIKFHLFFMEKMKLNTEIRWQTLRH